MPFTLSCFLRELWNSLEKSFKWLLIESSCSKSGVYWYYRKIWAVKFKRNRLLWSLLYKVYIFSNTFTFYPVLLNEENTFAESFKFFYTILLIRSYFPFTKYCLYYPCYMVPPGAVLACTSHLPTPKLFLLCCPFLVTDIYWGLLFVGTVDSVMNNIDKVFA